MQINYKVTEDFIFKVFNYYNGRINTFNTPAILSINWINYGTIAGSTRLPNIVEIKPMVVLSYILNKNQNLNYFYYYLLETIIHELFHVDQIIDYRRVRIDSKYIEHIERAVETQTTIYIMNHEQEIIELFGLAIPPEIDLHAYVNRMDNGYAYHRKRYMDHIIATLQLVFPNNKYNKNLFENIQRNINLLSGRIQIEINGTKVMVQDEKALMPIEQFNYFFYDNLYKYTIYNNLHTDYVINGNTIFISIHSNNRNKMIVDIN